MRRQSPLVALLAFVVLAGCGGLPPQQTETGTDVRIEVNNDAERAYVITVGVVPPAHRGLAVELVDGSVREFPDARGIEGIPDDVLPRAVSVRPVGDAVQSRTYRFPGLQGVSSVFEDVPLDATVYYSVAYPSGEEPLRTLGRLQCGPDAAFGSVTVRIAADGSVAVGNECTEA